MTILDGRALAKKIKSDIKREISRLKIRPGLAVIMVGDDPGSKVYVRLKEKAAQELGIYFKKHLFSSARQKEIISLIERLNKNRNIHGIIVQLPLPEGLDTKKIIQTVEPKKDVDAFHPHNMERLLQDLPTFIPPTINGILELLKSTGTNLTNKKALIVANSQTFAQPLAWLLRKQGIQDEIHLAGQKNLAQHTKQADILIVARGKPYLIKPDMIKRGVIIIDVGYSRVRGKPCGDVDPLCAKQAAFLSPVPGGVGPLTVVMLLKNVLLATKNKINEKK
jgi:methylenetetrahydrofolate dehydrogenase (NADP+)/methenyltetrahydrofolate cyclohydrolase